MKLRQTVDGEEMGVQPVKHMSCIKNNQQAEQENSTMLAGMTTMPHHISIDSLCIY